MKREGRTPTGRRVGAAQRGAAGAGTVLAVLAVLLAAGAASAATNNCYSYAKSADTGDPISAGSGVYHFSLPLFDLGGPLPLTYRLDYRTDAETEYTLQSGFRSNVNPSFDRMPNGITIRLEAETLFFEADGTNWVLDASSPTRYVLKETGFTATIGYYYLMDPVRERVWIFEKLGGTPILTTARLIRVTDRNGHHHDFTYSFDDRNPDRVEDGVGRSLDFTYWAGNLTRVTDQNGRHIDITYDWVAPDFNYDHVLRSVTNTAGKVTTFSYTYVPAVPYQPPIVRLTRPLGNAPYTQGVTNATLNGEEGVRVVSQSDAYGNTVHLAYSPSKNRVTVTRPDASVVDFEHFANEGVPKSITDAMGNTASFEQTSNEQPSRVGDRMGGTNNIAYHGPTGKIASFQDAEGHTTTFTYTPRVQTFDNPAYAESMDFSFYDLTRVDYPDGTHEEFAHDGRGNVLTHKYRAGSSEAFTYTAGGQVATRVNPTGGTNIYTYLADGNRLTAEDPETGITTYHYDGLKRLDVIYYPDSSTVEFAYDLNDRLVAVTDERGNQTTFTYDANGNLTRITDPKGHTTEFGHDLMDRVTTVTDRRGKTTTRTYSDMNRLASETDPNGLQTGYGYDPRAPMGAATWRDAVTVGGETWRTGYDDEGVPRSRTTPLGHTATHGTDNAGETTTITDAVGGQTTLTRDALERITAITDAVGRASTFVHNGWDSLDSVTMPGVGTAVYSRDDRGRLSRITDPNGQDWAFSHSPLGRLRTFADPVSNTWQYAYDARGRRVRTVYPDGVALTNTYDAAGNVTRWAAGGLVLDYTYDPEINRLATADGIAFAYDEAGNVTNTDHHGRSCGAAYDDGGRLTNVTYGSLAVTYDYDAATGLLTGVGDSLTGTQIGLAYDADRRLVGITRPNGVNTTYTYDDADRITRIRHGALGDLQYELDAAGQVERADRNVPLSAGDLLGSGAEALAYDAASQISTTGYTCDARGRRVTDPDHTAITWDEGGRLTGIDGATMTYNGLDDILSRTEGGVTVGYDYNYAIAAHPIMAEREETAGTVLRYYVYTPGGRLLYMIDYVGPTQARFFHFDRTGNTLFLTDGTGAVTDAYAYTPYGRLLQHNGPNAQPFTFVGEWGVRQEGASGRLYHMRARYYDAARARFLSRDPSWPVLSDARKLNPYGYARENPLGHIDPLGRDETDVEFWVSQFLRYNTTDLDDVIRMDKASNSPLYAVCERVLPATNPEDLSEAQKRAVEVLSEREQERKRQRAIQQQRQAELEPYSIANAMASARKRESNRKWLNRQAIFLLLLWFQEHPEEADEPMACIRAGLSPLDVYNAITPVPTTRGP